MEKRKIIFGSVFGALLVSFFANFVSAYGSYYGNLGNIIDSVVRAWEPVFQALLGGYGWSGMFLFERLLLFIVLISVVYLLVGRVPLFEDQKAIRWVIAVIVPLIGIRYIDYSWLSALILQYQVLAIVLTAVLPFILFFFFVHSISRDSSVLRKAMWILYAVVYLGLWSTAGDSTSPYIYLWTTIAAIVMVFMDDKIASILEAREMKKQGRQHLDIQVAEFRKQIDKINEYVQQGQLDPRAGRREIDKLNKQINWLIKNY